MYDDSYTPGLTVPNPGGTAYLIRRLAKTPQQREGIDYSAALVEKYGKKRFVTPAYEGKRTEWKQGFRAGKEVTEQARAFAEKWLSELK